MGLEIQDGFNFALGEHLASVLITGIGVISILAIIGLFYGIYGLYEYIKYKVKK